MTRNARKKAVDCVTDPCPPRNPCPITIVSNEGESMSHEPTLERHGRGAQTDPPNRFEVIHVEPDFEQLAPDERPVKTQFLVDHSRSIVSENDSPDIPFRYSVNPYRGCEHGAEADGAA